MKIRLFILLIVLVTAGLSGSDSSPLPSVSYPEDYRDWTHVKSVLVDENSPQFANLGGIHHIYANEAAVSVLKGEHAPPYPDGAALVFDLLHVQTLEGTTTEGRRKSLGIIVKDRSLYAQTGGWGFAQFVGDTRIASRTDPNVCFGCHQRAKATDFVFTEWRP